MIFMDRNGKIEKTANIYGYDVQRRRWMEEQACKQYNAPGLVVSGKLCKTGIKSPRTKNIWGIKKI